MWNGVDMVSIWQLFSDLVSILVDLLILQTANLRQAASHETLTVGPH